MKTMTTLKFSMLALLIMLSIFSCKKDKKNDPPPQPPAQTVTFEDLKKLSTGTPVKAPANSKISGIVISDVISKNIDSKTVIMQEAAGKPGIIITFDAVQSFAVGDQLDVDISGQTLANVNGEVVLQNIPVGNAKKTGTATITAKATTIAEINTNKVAWDGTLVSIAATEVSNSTSTYKGTLTVKDASGTTTSNILAGAGFENTALPPSVSALTGIVRINGNEVRVDIRKPADLVIGAITKMLTEDFSNITSLNTLEDDPALYYSFSTAFGEWTNDNANAYVFTGSPYGDGSFTTAGRQYVYLFQSVRPTQPEISANLGVSYFTSVGSSNLQGVKTISVTFAGSNSTKGHFYGTDSDIPAFDPAQDYFQIAIIPAGLTYINGNGDNLQVYDDNNFSPKVAKAGEFKTFTYTVPTRDQFLTLGVTPETADAWLAKPSFQINNFSFRRNSNYSPVLFDKVVFGFSN